MRCGVYVADRHCPKINSKRAFQGLTVTVHGRSLSFLHSYSACRLMPDPGSGQAVAFAGDESRLLSGGIS